MPSYATIREIVIILKPGDRPLLAVGEPAEIGRDRVVAGRHIDGAEDHVLRQRPVQGRKIPGDPTPTADA